MAPYKHEVYPVQVPARVSSGPRSDRGCSSLIPAHHRTHVRCTLKCHSSLSLRRFMEKARLAPPLLLAIESYISSSAHPTEATGDAAPSSRMLTSRSNHLVRHFQPHRVRLCLKPATVRSSRIHRPPGHIVPRMELTMDNASPALLQASHHHHEVRVGSVFLYDLSDSANDRSFDLPPISSSVGLPPP
jgi:hypothetical protein